MPRGSGLGAGFLTAVVAVACVSGFWGTGAAVGGVVDPCDAEGARAPGWCGDGGPARLARLAHPEGVAALSDGGFLIADTDNNVIRRVLAQGIIVRFAGIGAPGHSGDGGPATAAKLQAPTCVTATPDGSVLIRDSYGIRRVSAAGIISSVTGADPCLDTVLPDGSRLEVDRDGQEVLRVEPDGTETVVAGTGDCGSAGDGGPATEAQLAHPSGVASLTDGGFLIADTENNLIRRVSPDGTISVVAGREPPIALQCGASGEYVVPIYLVIRQPLRGRAKQPLLVSYETTYDVSVVFIIRRGSTILSRVRSKASSGLAKATLGVSLRPGTYALELRGSGTALGVGDEPIPFKKSDVAPLLVTR